MSNVLSMTEYRVKQVLERVLEVDPAIGAMHMATLETSTKMHDFYEDMAELKSLGLIVDIK